MAGKPTKKVVAEEEKDETLQEVLDKYQLSQDDRAANDFETNLDTYKDYYEGTSEETRDREAQGRSAILPPWPKTTVNHLLARFILTICGQKPYFSTAPLNKKSIESSKIANDVLFHQIDRETVFYQINRFVQSILAYGFAVFKTGWDFELDDVTITNWDIKKFYYSPHAEDLTILPWGIFELWRPLKGIQAEDEAFQKKWKKPLYKNLDELEERQAAIIDDETDKYTEEEKKGLQHILEYWDKDKKVVVANEETVILETENPFKTETSQGFVPAICACGIPKLEGILGTGEIETIEPYVREMATIKNQRMDNVNMALNPVLLRNINVEIENEDDLSNLRPGLQVKIDVIESVDIATVLTPLKFDFVTASSYQETAILERNIQIISGMFDYVLGEVPQQRETATGIARLQAAGGILFRYKILLALRTAFISLPRQMIAWDQKYLPEEYFYLLRETKEGIPGFRETNRKSIQGDFKFKELISFLDPDAIKEVKRAQLMESLRIIIQAQQILMTLPPAMKEKVEKLMNAVLATFDMPELEEIFGEAEREEMTPEDLMQRFMGQGMGGAPRGTPALTAPRTGARTEGRTMGGLMGRELGKLGGR